MNVTSKRFNKFMIVLFIATMLIFTLDPIYGKAGTTLRATYNRVQFYSWCGIPIFSLAAQGYYYTSNNKITSYSTTRSLPTINFLSPWTSSNESSSWIYKSDTRGTVEAVARFRLMLGIATNDFSLGLTFQDVWKFVRAEARP